MGAIDIARGAAAIVAMVVATTGGGQAPQALVYLSNVAPSADDKSNLVPRVNLDSVNIGLKPVQGGGKVSVPRG
ncbi:hypothetical protein NHH88_21190 [Oxalobacteraceae bacterium OTU3CAMAD1]|nr:hypothetical protein NHH88_21190 [Oxalobacteraceae bacterium OTU3CAMAD1]